MRFCQLPVVYEEVSRFISLQFDCNFIAWILRKDRSFGQ